MDRDIESSYMEIVDNNGHSIGLLETNTGKKSFPGPRDWLKWLTHLLGKKLIC